MDRSTVFHVGGESGSEVIAPLPYGPNMMADIYDATVKNKNEESSPPVNVRVFIGDKEIKKDIKVMIDSHVVSRNERGLTTERVVY